MGGTDNRGEDAREEVGEAWQKVQETVRDAVRRGVESGVDEERKEEEKNILHIGAFIWKPLYRSLCFGATI